MAVGHGMARYGAYGKRQHSGDKTREDEDYLTHEDPRGAGGHTLGNQGKTRHLTREEGQLT